MLTLLALLLMILPTLNAELCATKHFKNVSVGNSVLRPSDIISGHNVHLLGNCQFHCVKEENCFGYNFRVRPSSKYGVNCQLSNSTTKWNKTKIKYGPWVYYQNVLVTEDKDECLQGTHKCDPNANCSNTIGSYACQCRSGFSGNGKTCTDIDECSQGRQHLCDSNANCTNTEGSYDCQCRSGYLGNGKTCKVKGPLGESKILENEPLEFDKKLENWLPRKGNWKVCWRATKNRWSSKTFHSKCDGKVPTLTIVKVVQNNKAHIFGGYSTSTWTTTGLYKAAPGSFLFSLRNKDDVSPFKAALNGKHDSYAIWCGPGYGPYFGRGGDFWISSNAQSSSGAYNFGRTYQAPSGYTYGNANTRSLLAGSEYFTPATTETEVETLYLP